LRDIAWKFNKRSFKPKEYHILQEIQKLNIPHYTPTGKWFTKAVKYARAAQNQKRNRGFAFSQNDGSGDGISSIGQLDLVRLYDTTIRKPKG
jgi:phospholipid-transporting ATPase